MLNPYSTLTFYLRKEGHKRHESLKNLSPNLHMRVAR